MIIKMQLDGELSEAQKNGPQAWRMIDGLCDVQWWPIEGKIDEDLNRATEYDKVYYSVSHACSFPTSVGISARTLDGKSILVLANLSVYLLNDAGKTIERLN